jgi:magnesium and cobalt transporter
MARKTKASTSTTGLFQRIRSFAAPKDRNELLEVLRNAQTQGLLDADGLAMLEGALQVSDLQVRDIMIPRNQMIAVRRDDPVMRVVQTAVESGHSRFPVLEAESDDICGILLAKDLLRLMLTSPGESIQIDRLLRKAVFVPESKRVNLLLKELRLNRNHLAMVVDEYGGVAGLVTIEDVIEQIVGDIDDEFDVADENNIRREDDRQYSVRGATPVEEFNEYFGADFDEEDASTIAGIVVQQFGRLPRRSESITISGYEFRVMRADRRRIDGLRVITPPPPAVVDGASSADGSEGGSQGRDSVPGDRGAA